MSTIAATPREGLIFTANMLERATLDLLRRRLAVYGDSTSAQEGGDALVAPRSFTCAAAFDRWAEDQLPAIIVVSPGIVQAPELRGGSYDAVFGLAVGVACSASTEQATHALVRTWCAAIRACLVQGSSIDANVSELRFVDESYNEVGEEDRRTLVAGTVSFEARVDEIVSAYAGPLEAPDELGDWPTVATTSIEIEQEGT